MEQNHHSSNPVDNNFVDLTAMDSVYNNFVDLTAMDHAVSASLEDLFDFSQNNFVDLTTELGVDDIDFWGDDDAVQLGNSIDDDEEVRRRFNDKNVCWNF